MDGEAIWRVLTDKKQRLVVLKIFYTEESIALILPVISAAALQMRLAQAVMEVAKTPLRNDVMNQVIQVLENLDEP